MLPIWHIVSLVGKHILIAPGSLISTYRLSHGPNADAVAGYSALLSIEHVSGVHEADESLDVQKASRSSTSVRPAFALQDVEYTAAELAPPSEYVLPPWSIESVLVHSPAALEHDAVSGVPRPAATIRSAV